MKKGRNKGRKKESHTCISNAALRTQHTHTAHRKQYIAHCTQYIAHDITYTSTTHTLYFLSRGGGSE